MVKLFRSAHKKNTSLQSSNKHIILNIDNVNHTGEGVGRIDNKVYFVDGALPNEKVKARVTDNRKHYTKATLVKVLEPSSYRVKPLCAHFEQCGGCQIQHFEHAAQTVEKQKMVAGLFTKKGIELTDKWHSTIESPTWHYRKRARIACFYNKQTQHLSVGFRAKNSKKIIDINRCDVLSEPLADAIGAVAEILNSLEHKRFIDHIDYNDISDAKYGAVLLFNLSGALSPTDKVALAAFLEKTNLRGALKNKEDKIEWLTSEVNLSYHIEHQQIKFDLSNFTQINTAVNERMIEVAISWLTLKPEDNVIDLFCGLGNFSLPIASYVNSVLGVEGVGSMVNKAASNAELNGLNNCLFTHANLNESLPEQLKNYNKLILDPARAGAEYVCQNIRSFNVDDILYISCNPDSLARDSQHLIDNGYKVDKIRLLDMFPHTAHVETMVLFTKPAITRN